MGINHKATITGTTPTAAPAPTSTRSRVARTLPLYAFATLLMMSTAYAQQPPRMPEPGTPTQEPATSAGGAGRGEDVLQRFERQLPPVGMRLGDFNMSPRLQAGVTYDDNIFATKNNKKGDFIGNAAAGARVDSNFSRHYLGVEGGIDANKFASNDKEDYWHGDLAGRGRFDLNNDIQFGGDLSFRRLTEARGSPEDVSTSVDPLVYRAYRAAASAAASGALVVSRLEGGIERLEYEDGKTASGALVNTVDRDRNETFADATVGYRYLGPEQVYVRARVNDRQYDQAVASDGRRHDSDGYRAVIGMTADLGGLIFADVSAGYQEQSYEDSRFGSQGKPVGTARVLWNPSRLTTVRGEVNYEFAETFTNGTSPGYWRTSYLISVAHEVTYDVMAIGRLSLQERNFVNLTPSRDDTVYGGDVGLRYRIDRGLYVDGEYRYRHQDGAVSTSDFTKNVAMLRLRRIF
jgi:hypothetical protein